VKHHLDDLDLSSRFDSNPDEPDGRHLKWHEASQQVFNSFDDRNDCGVCA